MAIRSKRIIAQIIKELTQLGRDRLTLIMALGLPLVLLLVFGFSTSLDVNRINIAIQDLDSTRISREYISTFERTNKFKLVAQGSRVNVPRLLDTGQAAAGVIIPPEFARDLRRPEREAQVQVLIDGTDANTANIVRAYARATTNAFTENLRSPGSSTTNLITNVESWGFFGLWFAGDPTPVWRQFTHCLHANLYTVVDLS